MRLSSLHAHAVKIVSLGSSTPVDLPSVIQCNHKRACEVVRKCLVKDISSLFHDYFTVINHEKKTRNNDCLLRLPKIRTEYARKSFFFMGAKFTTTCQLKYGKRKTTKIFLNFYKIIFKCTFYLSTLI